MKTKLLMIVILISGTLLLVSFQSGNNMMTANLALMEESTDSYRSTCLNMMDTIINDPITNYPDPFCSATTIAYGLTDDTWVCLTVTCPDMTVEILFIGYQEAGNYEIIYDACNKPCGNYLATLQTDYCCEKEEMKKVQSTVLPPAGTD